MDLYIPLDFRAAQDILNGRFFPTTVFCFTDLNLAVKRAIQKTKSGEITLPCVLELSYQKSQYITQNSYKNGYNVKIKPNRIRLKWCSINNGNMIINYRM